MLTGLQKTKIVAGSGGGSSCHSGLRNVYRQQISENAEGVSLPKQCRDPTTGEEHRVEQAAEEHKAKHLHDCGTRLAIGVFSQTCSLEYCMDGTQSATDQSQQQKP